MEESTDLPFTKFICDIFLKHICKTFLDITNVFVYNAVQLCVQLQ